MKTYLLHLQAHMNWANTRTLASLQRMPVDEAVRLFAHVLTTEALYYERITEQDPWPQDFWPSLSLEQCATLLPQTAQRYQALLDGCSEADLQRPVRYRNSKGQVFNTPMLDMLLHVSLHGEHHRGQVARIIRAAGGDPAVTDFIIFTRA